MIGWDSQQPRDSQHMSIYKAIYVSIYMYIASIGIGRSRRGQMGPIMHADDGS
jgi:hypothetical protein